MSMWTQGAITHQTLLEILSRGEILPDINIEEEIELIESTKLAALDLDAAGGLPSDDEDEDAEGGDASEEQTSEVRAEVERRLKALASDDEEDEEDEEDD